MAGAGDRRRRRGETLLLPLGTFSLGSGGRTVAALSRAAALAGDFRRCVVLTFNHRADYDEIEAAWWERVGMPAGVQHRNLYDWLAGEELRPPAPPHPFVPAPDLLRRKGGRLWLRRDADGATTERYDLREDGTLERVRHDIDGRPVRWEAYDRAGRRHSVRFPADADGAVVVDRLTPTGRTYAVERRVDGRVTLRLPGSGDGAGASGVDEADHSDLVQRWLAELAAELAPVVHLVDDLRYVEPVLRAEPGGRVVATLHSNHSEPERPGVPHAYARLALDRLDELTVVTPTRQQLGDLRQLYGRDAPILLAPHAVAPRSPRRRPRTWARDLVRRPPTVVVVTRLVPVKRVDHLLRAFALVQAGMPEARLQVWGDGPDADQLAALTRELRLKRVRLAGRTTDAAAVLRRARVGASTSAREGFGLATAETLAAGAPVVSYDYRYGPRDLVVPGVNGYLVPDGDVAALAQRLLDLLQHPVRARLMGVAATIVRRRFSVRRHRRAWLRAIDRTRVRAS